MIWKIVRSELILNRRHIAYNAVLLVAMTVVYVLLFRSPGAVVAVSAIMVPTQATLLARCSRFHADATECALPVSRNQLILGKLFALAILMTGSVVLVLAASIVLPHPDYRTADLVHPDRMATLVLLVALVSSLLIPLILRFGFTGILILVLGLNVATVMVFLLTVARLIGDALDFLFRDLPRALAGFREAAGFPLFHLGALAATAVLWYLSLRVSQRIFRRREF